MSDARADGDVVASEGTDAFRAERRRRRFMQQSGWCMGWGILSAEDPGHVVRVFGPDEHGHGSHEWACRAVIDGDVDGAEAGAIDDAMVALADGLLVRLPTR